MWKPAEYSPYQMTKKQFLLKKVEYEMICYWMKIHFQLISVHGYGVDHTNDDEV